jgi:NNP family nitrate/nitrite transporter-like MFS transporter
MFFDLHPVFTDNSGMSSDVFIPSLGNAMPSSVPTPTLETSTQPVNGYQLLVAMLLMPLASALAVASWTLYALLAKQPLYVLVPLSSGVLLAWPAWYIARRGDTCRLMQWLLLGLALALGGFGMSSQPWEFLLVGVWLGLGGAVIATGIAHAKGWMPGRWARIYVALFLALAAGGGFSLRMAPLVVQAYGWRAAPLSLLIPLFMVVLLLWLFVESPE